MDAVTHDWVRPTTQLPGKVARWLSDWYAEDMAFGEPLTVDVADIESIRNALRRAEGEVVSREVQVRDAVEGLRYWQTTHQRLLSLASGNGVDSRHAAGESVRQRLLRFMRESRVPVDVDHAHQLLPNEKRKTVSWTLWDLARKEEIQKVTDGLYASLDFQPATPLNGGG